MTKLLHGERCALCTSGRSGKDGEHVLPNWLLGMWPSASGPFTLYRNGEPVLRRDGSVRTQTSAARFKLPMCRACNGVLDQRFERPAKPLIERIFNAGPALDPSEAELVGRWFVKTWLLLARPELHVSDPGYEPTPCVPLEPSLYEWMTVEPPTLKVGEGMILLRFPGRQHRYLPSCGGVGKALVFAPCFELVPSSGERFDLGAGEPFNVGHPVVDRLPPSPQPLCQLQSEDAFVEVTGGQLIPIQQTPIHGAPYPICAFDLVGDHHMSV